MAILFSASVLLVGPAWCSWLCYIGAWDDRLSRGRQAARTVAALARRRMRIIILVVVMGTAFLLGRLGVGPSPAGWLAAGFGSARGGADGVLVAAQRAT